MQSKNSAVTVTESSLQLIRWHGRLHIKMQNPTRTQMAEARRLMSNEAAVLASMGPDSHQRNGCRVCDNLEANEVLTRYYAWKRGELGPNATVYSRETWRRMQA